MKIFSFLTLCIALTLLVATVVYAASPQSNRDRRRLNNIALIVDAVHRYKDDHGVFPAGITTFPTHIGTASGNINLSLDLVPTYLSSIPKDPATGTDSDTQYTIYRDEQERIKTSAIGESSPAGRLIEAIR